MNRLPTEKQYGLLRVLAPGGVWVLAAKRGEWTPLIRRGWVASTGDDDGSRYLPPLSITVEGIRALADAAEKYGLPQWDAKSQGEPTQLTEPPSVTKLRDERDAAREEARAAKAEVHSAKVRLTRAQKALEGDVLW